MEKHEISFKVSYKGSKTTILVPSLITLVKFLKCFYYQILASKGPLGSFREMVVSTSCWVKSARKYVLMGNFNNCTWATLLKFDFTENIFLRSLSKQLIICILNNITPYFICHCVICHINNRSLNLSDEHVVKILEVN